MIYRARVEHANQYTIDAVQDVLNNSRKYLMKKRPYSQKKMIY